MQLPAETRKRLSLVFVIFLLSALVLSGCSGGANSPPTPQPAPNATVTMSISPSAVTPGQSATLTWTSNHATSCAGSGAWSGAQTTSGSTTVMLQGTGAQTYTLSCSGAGLPGQNAATLALSPTEGACTTSGAVRSHNGKRTGQRRTVTGSHS